MVDYLRRWFPIMAAPPIKFSVFSSECPIVPAAFTVFRLTTFSFHFFVTVTTVLFLTTTFKPSPIGYFPFPSVSICCINGGDSIASLMPLRSIAWVCSRYLSIACSDSTISASTKAAIDLFTWLNRSRVFCKSCSASSTAFLASVTALDAKSTSVFSRAFWELRCLRRPVLVALIDGYSLATAKILSLVLSPAMALSSGLLGLLHLTGCSLIAQSRLPSFHIYGSGTRQTAQTVLPGTARLVPLSSVQK